MENNDNSALLKLLTDAFNKMAEPLHEDILELNARLSAQRFLLEQMYANSFLGDPNGFKALMNDAIQAGTQRATRNSPMPEDYAIELQARIATHMQRFQESVMRRLREDAS